MQTIAIVRPVDLATLLSCKKSTLIAWEKAGVIPAAHRNGARFVFWTVQEIAAHTGKSIEDLTADLVAINAARQASRKEKKGKNDAAAEVTR